jgi:excisionase family DNA binding protein
VRLTIDRHMQACATLDRDSIRGRAAEQPGEPDAGKQRLLAVSLLYTENTDGELREPLLTVRRVAESLGVAAATVYARCSNGTLRHTRIGSAIRITHTDLEVFLEERTAPSRSRDTRWPLLLPAHHDELPPVVLGDRGERLRSPDDDGKSR